MRQATIELTGILATTDSFGRLRLCLIDFSETLNRRDFTWSRLAARIPASEEYSVPYSLPLEGKPDDIGICGECWVTLPRDSKRRARILALATTLRGKEVSMTVRPRRFSFKSSSSHNHGDQAAGTSLQFVNGLVALDNSY